MTFNFLPSKSAFADKDNKLTFISLLYNPQKENLHLYLFPWHSHNFAPHYNTKGPCLWSFATRHTPCVYTWNLVYIWCGGTHKSIFVVGVAVCTTILLLAWLTDIRTLVNTSEFHVTTLFYVWIVSPRILWLWCPCLSENNHFFGKDLRGSVEKKAIIYSCSEKGHVVKSFRVCLIIIVHVLLKWLSSVL